MKTKQKNSSQGRGTRSPDRSAKRRIDGGVEGGGASRDGGAADLALVAYKGERLLNEQKCFSFKCIFCSSFNFLFAR